MSGGRTFWRTQTLHSTRVRSLKSDTTNESVVSGFSRPASLVALKGFPRGGAEMFLNPNIRIGCSGWQYRHWRGDFYPAELPQHAWLDYYAQRFDTVEINNTFYRLPDAATFAAWGRRAPPGF